MRGVSPEERIAQSWQALRTARDPSGAMWAFGDFRNVLADEGSLDPLRIIGNPSWRAWAKALLGWLDESSSSACPLDTARGGGRPRARSHGQQSAHVRLLRLVTSGLEVRRLGDALLASLQHRQDPAAREAQLEALWDAAVALEGRLGAYPPGPVSQDAHWGKGLWRYCRHKFGEAQVEFEHMLEAALEWADPAGALEARLWSALCLDMLGHGDQARDLLNAALEQLLNSHAGRLNRPRCQRLKCLARLHRARLCRYAISDPSQPGASSRRVRALEDLAAGEQLAAGLGDDALCAMARDFRGDLYLYFGDRARALQEFEASYDLARQGVSGSARAVGYAHYSRAKLCMYGLNPCREALDPATGAEFLGYVTNALTQFEHVGDLTGAAMARLLRAQFEMCRNTADALSLLEQARKELRRHGPRRHLALACFRSGEFVIGHRSEIERLKPGENPINYLRAALSLVRRLSMADRQGLFREGLRQLPVDEWIDLLLEFSEDHQSEQDGRQAADALRAGLSQIFHDYGSLVGPALSRLRAAASGSPPDLEHVLSCADAIGLVFEAMSDSRRRLSLDSDIGWDMQVTGVALPVVVTRCVDLFGVVGCRPDVRVSRNLPSVQADPQLLERVVFNLLVNAQRAIEQSRHSQPSRTIKLHGRAQPARGAGRRFVELTVQDWGDGVPPQLLGRLFQAGVKGFRGGTGSGLCFCAEAMRRMHGRIYLKDPGSDEVTEPGATFALCLPVSPVPPTSPGSQPRR